MPARAAANEVPDRTHEPHLVLSALRANPGLLQDAHMFAPMAGQPAPHSGTPFGQVHTFHAVQAKGHVCGLIMRHDCSQKCKITVLVTCSIKNSKTKNKKIKAN